MPARLPKKNKNTTAPFFGSFQLMARGFLFAYHLPIMQRCPLLLKGKGPREIHCALGFKRYGRIIFKRENEDNFMLQNREHQQYHHNLNSLSFYEL